MEMLLLVGETIVDDGPKRQNSIVQTVRPSLNAATASSITAEPRWSFPGIKYFKTAPSHQTRRRFWLARPAGERLPHRQMSRRGLVSTKRLATMPGL